MLGPDELRSFLDEVSTTGFSGRLYRVVTTSSLLGMTLHATGRPRATRLQPDLLFAGGPRRGGGRFTPIGGPDSLYLASRERTAHAEWSAGLKSLFPGFALPPKTVFMSRAKLTRVLDLTRAETQRLLNTNLTELAQPWKAVTDPPTQRLGKAAFDSGRVSAIRYRSVRDAQGTCVMVFPKRLLETESVSVLDPQQFFSQLSLGGPRPA